jgi:hypothetical protein
LVHRYNSVKRFVCTLNVREPERFDVLDRYAEEEAQVDFGEGALTWLFVVTPKYSDRAAGESVADESKALVHAGDGLRGYGNRQSNNSDHRTRA